MPPGREPQIRDIGAHGVTSAARITAANLRVDAVTAEVLRGFEAAHVQSLLLKGASVTRWLSTAEILGYTSIATFSCPADDGR